jgi:DNA-directed RNA polymerase subunit RPC12/RpoP
MANPNITGKPIKCQHCGYSWLTRSNKRYVPCPRCLYRVPNYKKSVIEKPAQQKPRQLI